MQLIEVAQTAIRKRCNELGNFEVGATAGQLEQLAARFGEGLEAVLWVLFKKEEHRLSAVEAAALLEVVGDGIARTVAREAASEYIPF